MLIANSSLINRPVQSLHTGTELARTIDPVVDYENLRVIAFDIAGPEIKQEGLDVVLTDEIREVSPVGLIVDSIDSLATAADIVRVQHIKDVRFSLIGLKVETKQGKKLGTVDDFIVELPTFSIQQLVVKRPALKSFLDPELTISRDKIVEVNDFKIIIKDDKEKSKQKAPAPKKVVQEFVPNYANPFRNPEFVEKSSPLPADSQNPAE